MLISFIFGYSKNYFVVFYLSFYFVLGQDPTAATTDGGGNWGVLGCGGVLRCGIDVTCRYNTGRQLRKKLQGLGICLLLLRAQPFLKGVA